MKLLLVEGKDEKKVCENFLKHMKIEGVVLADVGGKDNFLIEAKTFFEGKKYEVSKLAILRDAEENKGSAVSSINGFLANFGLKLPKKEGLFEQQVLNDRDISIGYFVCSKPNQNAGMLEDLFLETVKNSSIFQCVEQFIQCVITGGGSPKNLSKAKVQAYLAGVLDDVRNLGEASENGGKHPRQVYWNFDALELNDLKVFLEHLR